MKKRLIISLITLFFLVPTPVLAEDSAQKESIPEATITLSADSGEEKELQFYDSEGFLTTLSVSVTSVSGEKQISLTNAKISMSFKIYIVGGNIIDAYGAQYRVAKGITVTGSSLSKDSSKQATYYVYCHTLLSSATRWLRANISTGELVVTYG